MRYIEDEVTNEVANDMIDVSNIEIELVLQINIAVMLL